MNSTRMTAKMATINTSVMTANLWPRPPSAIREIQRGICATTERGFFLSSFAAQCRQASHLHLSTFRKNGVATSWLQAGHFAMGTPFGPTVPWFFHGVNGTTGVRLTRNEWPFSPIEVAGRSFNRGAILEYCKD